MIQKSYKKILKAYETFSFHYFFILYFNTQQDEKIAKFTTTTNDDDDVQFERKMETNRMLRMRKIQLKDLRHIRKKRGL